MANTYILIASNVLSSSASSVTFSSIPATYNNLQLVIRDFQVTNDQEELIVKFNGSSTSDYANGLLSRDTQAALAFTLSSVAISVDIDNAAQDSLLVMDLFDYANTTTRKMMMYQGICNNSTTPTSVTVKNGYIYCNKTAAISSITFTSNSDFLAGTVLLYGVK
jgi:hypothetical protein